MDYKQLEAEIANVLLSDLKVTSKNGVWEYASHVPGIEGLERGKKIWELNRILRKLEAEESELNPHKVACAVARALTQQGKRLPLALQAYIVHTAEGGKHLRSNVKLSRDLIISDAVDQACKVGGLPRTRSVGSDAPSGCIIVSRALARIGIHMTPGAVDKLYQRLRNPSRSNRGS
jgi:hypothetical protein